MRIVIDIPEEQIKKSLEENAIIYKDEGIERSSVDITMHYTDGRLEFVDVSRCEDYYSCKYKVLSEDIND